MDTPSSLPSWLRRTATINYGLLAVLSLLPAALSPMMFDAPGSENNSLTVALVCGTAAAPLVLGGSALALATPFGISWRPLTLATLLLLVALLVYVIVVVVLLDKWCGGSFTCR